MFIRLAWRLVNGHRWLVFVVFPALTEQRRNTVEPRSVGAPLKLPRRFEGILDGTRIASREVSDNHHVLDVPSRNAEGFGKPPQHRVADVEVGPDHHMLRVKLACDDSPVIPPLGQPIPCSAVYTCQGPGQARNVVHLH